MMEVWSYIVSNLMNMFAMLDIWLILKLLFGCDMRTTKRNLSWATGIFLIVFGTITFFADDEQAFAVLLLCVYIM